MSKGPSTPDSPTDMVPVGPSAIQFAQLIGAQPTFASFVDHALEELGRTLDAGMVTFNRIDMRTRRATVISRPFRHEQIDAVESVNERFLEHPMFSWAHQQEAMPVARLSDVASVEQLATSTLYQEVLVPIGAAFSLFVFLSPLHGDQWVYFVANRADRDFGRADLQFAQAVQLPLIATLARWSVVAESDAAVALTRREKAVLGQLAAGLTAEAMARVLGASPATVRKHLQNMYAKLDVQDRLGAVLRARALGLLQEEDLSTELALQIRTELRAGTAAETQP